MYFGGPDTYNLKLENYFHDINNVIKPALGYDKDDYSLTEESLHLDVGSEHSSNTSQKYPESDFNEPYSDFSEELSDDESIPSSEDQWDEHDLPCFHGSELPSFHSFSEWHKQNLSILDLVRIVDIECMVLSTYSKTINITELGSRYRLVHKSFIRKIFNDTGAVITISGNIQEASCLFAPPLYLRVNAPSEKSLQHALQATHHLIDSKMPSTITFNNWIKNSDFSYLFKYCNIRGPPPYYFPAQQRDGITPIKKPQQDYDQFVAANHDYIPTPEFDIHSLLDSINSNNALLNIMNSAETESDWTDVDSESSDPNETVSDTNECYPYSNIDGHPDDWSIYSKSVASTDEEYSAPSLPPPTHYKGIRTQYVRAVDIIASQGKTNPRYKWFPVPSSPDIPVPRKHAKSG